MTRTALVTGAASGIGRATAEILGERGYEVIGADIYDADISVDLSTDDGRRALVAEAGATTGGKLDVVLAVAGLASPTATTVAVNYFGMVSTLAGLRPLLERSASPRAAGVSSMASMLPVDADLVAAMATWEEDIALKLAREMEGTESETLIYPSTKKAFAQWIRRTAPTPEWAGAGIPLNAVAPGVVSTPMTTDLLGTDEAKAELLRSVPMPLNGIAQPEAVASLLAWLASEDNTHLCGQVVYIDGGCDVTIRGDSVW